MDEVDVVLPRNLVNEMVEYIHNLEKEIDIRIKSFGRAGDGNLHAYILKDNLTEEEWNEKKNCTMDTVTINIMRGIKRTFDTNNILNPNKIFDHKLIQT